MTKTISWLWPDRIIRKRESRRLRDEHNALVNSHAELLEVCSAFLRAPSCGSNGPGSINLTVQDFNMRAAEAAKAKAIELLATIVSS